MSTIRILHLSDLQFGKKNRYPDKNFEIFAKTIVDDLSSTLPDIITVTGDITETASEIEYNHAELFFNKLLTLFENKGKKTQLYIVPGNHDVNFAETKAFENPIKEDLFEAKFSNYNRFLKSHFGHDNFKTTFDRPHFGVCDGKILILGLNSAIEVTHEVKHGEISLDKIQRAIEEAEKKDTGNTFKMAIVHHNFTRKSNNDETNIRDADDFQDKLIEKKFQLLLHGHRHHDSAELRRNLVTGKQIFILATGSASLNPDQLPDVQNQYQLITLEIDSTIKVTVNRKAYSGRDGKWYNGASGDFHFFIYPENIRSVVESIQKKVCSICSKTPTIHFSEGFEKTKLYETLLEIAQKRLWIFGRKNKKLFSKDNIKGLNNILKKKQTENFDLRILFLSPKAKQNILQKAHADSEFIEDLKSSIKDAKNFFRNKDLGGEYGIKFDDVSKYYTSERKVAMIIIDHAVLFSKIQTDKNEIAKPLTGASFDIVSTDSVIGRDLEHQFKETWN